MAQLITALFTNSDHAGMAVSELKNKDLGKDISIAARDERTDEVHEHSIESDDGAEGTTAGAVAGGAIGGIGSLLAGLTTLAIPGTGIFLAGPLAVALTSAAAGAAAGGIVGALVDKGIPDNQAKEYKDAVERGEVLIAVETNKPDSVSQILQKHGASALNVSGA